MRAIVFDTPGDESVLRIGEVASPPVGPREIRIAVRATAVNRADLLQRQGAYPPPPGASPILGLECAGVVLEAGEDVHELRTGDRVMALLPGGGYAEEAVVHAGSAIRVPESLSDEEAGAFPETFLTAFLNLFLLAGAAPGASALVHGGGSGVGTAAIQLCREAGVRLFVTAGSAEKVQRCLELGADVGINYRTEDFARVIEEKTAGRGVEIILDHIGAEYLDRNLASLAVGGRLVVIGAMGGRRAQLDLGPLLSRRLHLIGSTLRSRPVEEKREIVRAFLGRFGDALREGRLRPVIDRILPLERAEEAHRWMRESRHFGKIVLRVS